jgi:hypothetical protein
LMTFSGDPCFGEVSLGVIFEELFRDVFHGDFLLMLCGSAISSLAGVLGGVTVFITFPGIPTKIEVA